MLAAEAFAANSPRTLPSGTWPPECGLRTLGDDKLLSLILMGVQGVNPSGDTCLRLGFLGVGLPGDEVPLRSAPMSRRSAEATKPVCLASGLPLDLRDSWISCLFLAMSPANHSEFVGVFADLFDMGEGPNMVSPDMIVDLDEVLSGTSSSETRGDSPENGPLKDLGWRGFPR